MTGDPTRDNEATPHDFAAPDVPWDDNDYRAARDQREAEQKARMDAAHEKAKAERERCGRNLGVDWSQVEPTPGYFLGATTPCGRPAGHDDDCWPEPLAEDRTEGEDDHSD